MATNQLGKEKSPYLLQHKDNPIGWFAWGEDAFKAAREQGKPVFLSIGYSTCHWCHVMAHESFEDQEVADRLNADYISIKVDREERPDVDDIYMKALQTLSGGGGWPMSVWLTPEGKPFFAGTYFPKYRFMQVLRRVTEIWNKDRAALLKDGDQLLATVASLRGEDPGESTAAERKNFLGAYTTHFNYAFDEVNGGFGGAPKFPQTMNLMLMMRQDQKTKLNHAETMVTSTLTHMLRGGIYDHLAGGFHRYSVDERWLVPHFEKMLYDQAMIALALLEGHRTYGDPEFARVVRETLDYVLLEMTHARGGFYSAQDADSFDPVAGHNEEGYFATYSYDELKEALNADELAAIETYYGATAAGNFEGRNILNLAGEYSGAEVKARPEIVSAFEKLRRVRAAKPLPHLDDKIIAAWNGWMIWAFARAGQQLNEPRYTEAALRAYNFIRETMWSNGRLARFWRDGEAKAAATAEDYASMVLAGVELSQLDSDPEIVKWTLALQKVLDDGFWDASEGGYFTSDGRDPLLPLRTKDDYDGVSPGINSMCAYNLTRLYALTGEVRFRQQGDKIQEQLFAKLKKYPSGLPFLGLGIDFSVSNPRVAVAVGEGWPQEVRTKALKDGSPYVLWTQPQSGWPIASGKSDVGIYVCEEGRCLQPARTSEEALRQLSTTS